MIALHEEHLDDPPAMSGELLGVALDHHAVLTGIRAGVGHLAVDLDRADAAVPGGRQVLVMAQPGNVDTGRVRRLQDGLAVGRLHVAPIEIMVTLLIRGPPSAPTGVRRRAPR